MRFRSDGRCKLYMPRTCDWIILSVNALILTANMLHMLQQRAHEKAWLQQGALAIHDLQASAGSDSHWSGAWGRLH